MAAGYEIPISVGVASSFSVPQSVVSPTIFNFGTGNVEGGEYDNEQSPIQPVTATASAALGGDSNAASSTPIALGGKLDTKTILIFGAVGAALLTVGIVAIYLIRRK